MWFLFSSFFSFYSIFVRLIILSFIYFLLLFFLSFISFLLSFFLLLFLSFFLFYRRPFFLSKLISTFLFVPLLVLYLQKNNNNQFSHLISGHLVHCPLPIFCLDHFVSARSHTARSQLVPDEIHNSRLVKAGRF